MERMKPNETGHTRSNEWSWIGAIAQDLNRLAKKHKLLVWTAAQTNRSGLSANSIDLSMSQSSIRHLQEASAVIAMNQERMNEDEVIMKWKALKMRHSKRPGSEVRVKCNLATMTITDEIVENVDLSESRTTDDDGLKTNRKAKVKQMYKDIKKER